MDRSDCDFVISFLVLVLGILIIGVAICYIFGIPADARNVITLGESAFGFYVIILLTKLIINIK